MINKTLFMIMTLMPVIILAGCAKEENTNKKEIELFEAPMEYQTETSADDSIPSNISLDTVLEGSEKYIITDLSTGLKGIYDLSTKEYIIPACLTEIGRISDNGLMAVCKNNTYGYMNEEGEQVIGFFYDQAWDFNGDRAIVKTNGRWGAIDESGNYILKPIYNTVYFFGDHLFLVEKDGLYGACNLDGEIAIEIEFLSVSAENGYIFAEINNAFNTGWYTVYDLYGTTIVGENSPRSGARAVRLSNNDIYRAHFYGISAENKYGYSSNSWYGYLNKDFQMLSDACYSDVGAFNNLGYAVANYQVNSLGEKAWVVVKSDGSDLCTLPDLRLGEASNSYIESNGYFAIGKGSTGSYGMNDRSIAYALVNLKNFEITEYDTVQFIEPTSCTIVTDVETGLYGLYDGFDLKYECLYNNIQYIYGKGYFLIERGNEQFEYTPNSRG